MLIKSEGFQLPPYELLSELQFINSGGIYGLSFS